MHPCMYVRMYKYTRSPLCARLIGSYTAGQVATKMNLDRRTFILYINIVLMVGIICAYIYAHACVYGYIVLLYVYVYI